MGAVLAVLGVAERDGCCCLVPLQSGGTIVFSADFEDDSAAKSTNGTYILACSLSQCADVCERSRGVA